MAFTSLRTPASDLKLTFDDMEPFSTTVNANKWLQEALGHANQYTAEKDYQRALQVLDFVIKSSPKYIPAYLDLGNLYYKQNKYLNAYRMYGLGRDLLAGSMYRHEIPKENRNVYYELMKGGRDCEKRLGIANMAPTVIQPEILNLSRPSARINDCDYTSIRRLLAEAKSEAEKKNNRRSIEILTTAILLDPDLVEGYMKRGKLYYKLNKYVDASIDFDIGKRKLSRQVSFLNPKLYPHKERLYNKYIKWENKCQRKLSPSNVHQRGKAFMKLFA